MLLILAYRTLWSLAATSLVIFVDGSTNSIASVFISDIINSREYEVLGSIIHLILLIYSLILDKLLMLCLVGITTNLT